ncbi:transposable element Tcb2 transposase [Trichonephila clavipes]|nr:transposable element Tcb2 transposase [Trichonephila clavipes]
MTTQRYVHDILQLHVLPLMQRLPRAIFQQINARPHMARVSQDCVLHWPARYPDLSPIEHIWDHFGCDEGHFWLNDYVNKQNCPIWSEANPQVYVETPLHPEKLTVWCALWAGGILQKR